MILPATAGILAKVAHGIRDDLVSSTAVAVDVAVVLVPSMNQRMWTSPVVRANARRVNQLGHHVLEPGWGLEVADMQPTFGATPPPGALVERLLRILAVERKQPSMRGDDQT